MRFNEYLKKYLEKNHLSYVTFGVKAGINPSILSKIGSFSNPIEDKNIIEKFSKMFNKNPEELEKEFPDDIFYTKTKKEKAKTPDEFYDELNKMIHQVPVDKLYELEIFIKAFLKRLS